MVTTTKSGLLDRIKSSLESIELPQNEDSSKTAKTSLSVNNIHPAKYVMPSNVDLEREWIFCPKCQREHPQIKKVVKNVNRVQGKSHNAKPLSKPAISFEVTPSFLLGGN